MYLVRFNPRKSFVRLAILSTVTAPSFFTKAGHFLMSAFVFALMYLSSGLSNASFSFANFSRNSASQRRSSSSFCRFWAAS